MRDGKVLFRDLNILIVDDSEFIQRLIGSMLEGVVQGRLFLCSDTDIAEEALARDVFHLMIVDRELNGACGLEFIRRIRARKGPNRTVPILALSESVSRETVLEALMSGAHSLLCKPLSRRDLAMHASWALSDPRVFVPFGTHVVPLKPEIAARLGTTPAPAEVLTALAASIFAPSPGGPHPLAATARAPKPAAETPDMHSYVLL